MQLHTRLHLQKENLEGVTETNKFIYLGTEGVGTGKMKEKNVNETLCGTFFCLFWGLKKIFFIVVKYR